MFFELQLLFEATAGNGVRRDVAIDDIIVLDDICPPEGELPLWCCVRSPCAPNTLHNLKGLYERGGVYSTLSVGSRPDSQLKGCGFEPQSPQSTRRSPWPRYRTPSCVEITQKCIIYSSNHFNKNVSLRDVLTMRRCHCLSLSQGPLTAPCAGYCDFEMDYCGWVNSPPANSTLEWDWISGEDHTTDTNGGLLDPGCH